MVLDGLVDRRVCSEGRGERDGFHNDPSLFVEGVTLIDTLGGTQTMVQRLRAQGEKDVNYLYEPA